LLIKKQLFIVFDFMQSIFNEMADLQREIIVTKDGSHSLFVPSLNEQYHSIHGAKQEAEHVFLKMGLGFHKKEKLRVFEVGFGTGLNALLTCDFALKNNKVIEYVSIEKYPVTKAEFSVLNYGAILNLESLFMNMFEQEWEVDFVINDSFSLQKIKKDLKKDILPEGFDVIYFDAFAPNKQPDMWSVDVFTKMRNMLSDGGCLVTYCCQGQARRTMMEAGFTVEKVEGPPGKREMLRAIK
jgi:tRNA U34 5-methylaminomethyl-2-thiouridine-forming methyltransferase MnmC